MKILDGKKHKKQNQNGGPKETLLIDIFPTGIEEMYRLEMTAYQNPVYDKVIFKGEDPTGEYDIRLVDKTGKVLDQKGIDYRDLSLDMKKLLTLNPIDSS